MRQQQIGIQPRAMAALLASVARTVVANDARPPITANDIAPLLQQPWPRARHAVESLLAQRLRGRLIDKNASPETVARSLIAVICGEGQTSRGTGRVAALDELSAELKQLLRDKLDPQELAAVLNAVGESDNADDPSREAPLEGEAEGEAEDDATIDPRDRHNGDGLLVGKIRALVAGKLTDKDGAEVERCLARLLQNGGGGVEGEAEGEAEDEPPEFPGQPLVGGGMRPLNSRATVNPKMGHPNQTQALGENRSTANGSSAAREIGAQDVRLYKARVQSENRASFNERFPGAARIGGGQPPVQYRDGTVVKDTRALATAPQRGRSAAMDSRGAKSFDERFPNTARIKVV